MNVLSKLTPAKALEIIRVVQAVQAVQALSLVKAKRRRPGYEVRSFFSKHDIWEYHGISDGVLCEKCEKYMRTLIFRGNHLRATFPDLIIIGPNMIIVFVHIHCRCYLERLTEAEKR